MLAPTETAAGKLDGEIGEPAHDRDVHQRSSGGAETASWATDGHRWGRWDRWDRRVGH